ncbi:MAG: CHRD domain-containing protein [Candidatus Eremiobacter antarcticus]|nr:hypothetical protein [Candidatus Eremiobacteraeota bacterium]
MKSACLAVVACSAVLALTTSAYGSPHRDITLRMHSQHRSGESGTATLTDLGGNQTRVVIHVDSENTTGDQPAHVHPGTCKHLNPIPRYVLHNVVLGRSNTVIDAPMSKLLGGHWSINVHESKDNLKRYVSCGTIP